MQTTEHLKHIASRVSHNNCQECRADCERQWLRPQWTGYQFITDYLAFATPRLAAIKAGEQSVNARIWHRKFVQAMQRRITLKGGSETGRKRNDGYLERLGQFPRATDAAYLRRFASRGASTLH